MALFMDSRPLNGSTGHEAGRELLAGLYRRVTGEEPPPIAIAPRGKPYFLGSPWHFSISHTKGHVFCALADCPVGIDAEEDKSRALLTFWVLKEAAAKLTGEGLRGYPIHTAFSLSDPRVTERDGCLVAVLTNTI